MTRRGGSTGLGLLSLLVDGRSNHAARASPAAVCCGIRVYKGARLVEECNENDGARPNSRDDANSELIHNRRFLSTSAFSLNESKPVAPTPDVAAPQTASEEEIKADHSPIDPLHPSEAPAAAVETPAAESTSELFPEAVETAEAVQAPSAEEVAAQAAEVQARTVFVGGLSWNIDNEWLRAELEKALDSTDGVITTRVARDHMGKSKGCARFSASPQAQC